MTTESNNWGQFAQKFQGLLMGIPPAPLPPLSGQTKGRNSMELVGMAAEAEAPHKAAIESAIAAWSTTGQWPALDAAARGWLRVRMETALNFVLRFCEAGAHPETSLIPWPDGLGRKDVAVWLLADWWEHHGRMDAVDSWIVAFHDAAAES